MSRRKSHDNSATVSLFPFLAVLLCTMGALLVVLVAVSRSAKLSAVNEALTGTNVVSADEEAALQEKLAHVERYNAKLKKIKAEADAKLREEQLRMQQVESHMRDLQAELE